MPDWQAYVRSRLASARFNPQREERIVRQLADQLEDFFQEALSKGLSPDQAQEYTRSQIPDWERLIADIRRTDPSVGLPRSQQLSDAAVRVGRRRGGLSRLLSDLLDDLLYGLRVLTRRPGFALVAALTLSLGIGASTAIFSVINATLLRPLPYPQPERLGMLWETYLQRGWTRQLVSLGNLPDYRAVETVEDLAAMRIVTGLLTGDGAAETVSNAKVEYRFFSVLGVQPSLGHAFSPQQDRPDHKDFVILSHALWMRRFAGLPDVLGRSLQLDGRDLQIVGVMPEGFRFPSDADLWTPLGRDFSQWSRGLHSHQAVMRLKESAGWEQAESELKAVAAALREKYPDSNSGWDVTLVPLREQKVGFVRGPLTVLMAAAALLLLIACANVAGLLLAWSEGRAREFGVRAALGAGRLRLIRQLLAENALLALAGGLLGVLLAWGGIQLLLAAGDSAQPRLEALLADATSESGQLPRLQEVGIDSSVLLFALSASLGTILLFGLSPALRTSRFSPQSSLKEGRGSRDGAAGVPLRTLLMVTQVALALVLLLGSGLLLRSFQQLLQIDPGFQARGLLSMRITVPYRRYPDDPSRAAFHARILEAVRSLPGVEDVASYWFFPFYNGTFPNFYSITKYAGEAGNDPANRISVLGQICTTGYHQLMRIPLASGRYLSEHDTQDTHYVAVVSQTLADQLWPGEDPLGKQFRLGKDPTTVVGVVQDTKRFGLTAAPPPVMYIPFGQNPHTDFGLLVRAGGSPMELAGPIRSALRKIDSQLALSDIALVEDVIGSSLAKERLTTLLAGGFALAALLLALFGLYGLISFQVGRRRREFGIRVAIGARSRDVLSLVLSSGLRLALLGVLLGVAASLALLRLLSGLLYEVSPTDPLTFLVAPLLLLATALPACYVPARRATRIDPIQALRCE